MSELRKDPLVERWVIVAPERALRPNEFVSEPVTISSAFDPFAEGNEPVTTPELLAYRSPESHADGPGWRVRVVPNKYPAITIDQSDVRSSTGLYQSKSGLGSHEVIVECPQMEANLSRLDVENIREVLQSYRDRLNALKQDDRLAHALIFKNKGVQAGASLQHAHSQLMATTVVPVTIRDELVGAEAYFREHNRSIFEAMIECEISDGRRIVLDTPEFLAFCPYASRFSYETWIVPKRGGSHYEHIPVGHLPALADCLKRVLGKLEVVLDDPPYNYVLHSAPFKKPDLPYFAWHFEIYPRRGRIAGYEWGSGYFINDTPPEVAAERLREAHG